MIDAIPWQSLHAFLATAPHAHHAVGLDETFGGLTGAVLFTRRDGRLELLALDGRVLIEPTEPQRVASGGH